MYFGFLLHNIKTERIELPGEVRICGIIFALLVWVSFIRDFQSFSLVCCNVGRGAADIFASLCGCVIILLFSRYISIVIWMKLVLIVSGTVICSKWNLMRRVSGRE